jgi:RimJ/RimL family protein N-acetyltransferase
MKTVMKVELIPITKANWENAAKLEVREDQRDFVAANVWTIAESRFYPAVQMRGIMANGEMVGFLAYGKDADDGDVWLYRFMIDQRHQGKGFGRAGLLAAIEEWKANPDIPHVTLGYEPTNLPAERLYLSVGFVKGEMAPWGERTAKLMIER